MKNSLPRTRCPAFLLLVFALFLFTKSSNAQKIRCEVEAPPDDNLIAALSQSIKRNPNDAMARVNRARAYLKLLRYDDVLADVKAAVTADSQLSDAYYLRGEVYETRANYPKAIEAYDRAIELNSLNKDYFFGRGFSYYMIGDYDLGAKDFSTTLTTDGQFMNAYFNLGTSQVRLKMPTEARVSFSATLKLAEKYIAAYEKGPCLTDSYLNKGLVEHFLKNDKEAEMDLKTANELANSHDAEPRYNLGIFYLDMKYYQFALDEFNDAIKIDPSYAEVYKKRAEVYDRMFQKGKAAADRAKYDELSSRKELPMPQAPISK